MVTGGRSPSCVGVLHVEAENTTNVPHESSDDDGADRKDGDQDDNVRRKLSAGGCRAEREDTPETRTAGYGGGVVACSESCARTRRLAISPGRAFCSALLRTTPHTQIIATFQASSRARNFYLPFAVPL